MTDNLPQKSAPKEQGVLGIINSPAMMEQIKRALPRHMSPDRMTRLMTTLVKRTPKLASATQASLLGALMTCSQLGLEPEPALGHIYLLPFEERDKTTGQKEMRVQTIIGYRGMIDLARRTGQVSSVCARVVHENDEFRYVLGLVEELRHVPTIKGDPGEPIGAYAVWHFRDGSTHSEFMNMDEIKAIARRSKTYRDGKWSGPWATDFEEMMKKTVLRRSFKMVPVSVEIERNIIDHGASIDDTAIDADFTIGEQEQVQIEAPAPPENIKKPEPPQAQPEPGLETHPPPTSALPADHPLNPDVMAQVGPASLPEYVHANYVDYINLDENTAAQAEVRRAWEFITNGKPFPVYIICPESGAMIAKAECQGCLVMDCPMNQAKPKAKEKGK